MFYAVEDEVDTKSRVSIKAPVYWVGNVPRRKRDLVDHRGRPELLDD